MLALNYHADSRSRATKFIGATAFVILFSTSAHAGVITQNSSSGTAVASWSNCPAVASFNGQLCNYAAVFAARGTAFKPFLILQLANIALYTNGTAKLAVSATGYMQPTTQATIPAGVGSASAKGTVYLYGNCGDPSNIYTCYYYGTASIQATWTGSGSATSWNNQNNVAGSGNTYKTTNAGSTRAATATPIIYYNGSSWIIGKKVDARLTAITETASVTCPGACSQTAQDAPVADTANQAPDAEMLSRIPPTPLQNKGDVSNVGAHRTDGEISEQSCNVWGYCTGYINSYGGYPFGGGVMGQVQGIFQSSGYYGSPALHGLDNFVQGLLTSYAASGRPFGFYQQNLNNDAYWRGQNYNSGAMFYRDSSPYGTFGFRP